MLRILARHLIQKRSLQDSFYIVNLDTVVSNINLWKKHLPQVEPFYAMKCNPDKQIIKIMKDYDMGFDCASKTEITTVQNMGVPSNKIIFAHPCKKIMDLQHAKATGIEYAVFDSKDEIKKMTSIYPEINGILRIRVQNDKARVQLGKKYGADDDEWDDLLNHASDLGMRVNGVSFHIGSASNDVGAFHNALTKVHKLMGKAYSKHDLSIVDIGGGFQKQNFIESATTIRNSINTLFGKDHNIRFIAEPGRFFVEDSSTFFTPIIGKRKRLTGPQEYWISDGLYGSMNCIIYDHHVPNYETLRIQRSLSNPIDANEESIVWGSTCDSYDKVMENAKLPPNLEVGDFIQFNQFGAYTLSGACDFNGINFTSPFIFYVKNNEIIAQAHHIKNTSIFSSSLQE